MPWKSIAAIVCAGLVLAGCSPESEGSPTRDRATAEAAQGDPLDALTGDQMCDLLPTASVEQAFDVTVDEAEGDRTADAPFTIVSCNYAIPFTLEEVDTLPPSVSTAVRRGYRSGPREALDRSFSDADDKVVGYEEVDGLGETAAYGPDALLGDAGDKLVVLFEADGEAYQLTVGASPDGSLEQLRPLAEELLDGLQATLGG